MMSKKQLAAMLCLHITYLLLGASIFYHIESPLEMAKRNADKLDQLEIQNLLYESYLPSVNEDKQHEILTKLAEYCGKPIANETFEEAEGPIKWDFYHSFFFAYTVVSTIGYGNLAPTTSLGRILMIFYGLFGIPINGILLANLGEYFAKQLIKTYSKYKENNEAEANKLDFQFHRLGMFGQIVLYLIPGFLFFIFLPACLFVHFEEWDYVLAVYYAFVTLTTIGFGDYVAGTQPRDFGIYFVFYEIFLIVWITFGLGYLVMLFGFITSGMRSKKLHKLEHKLVQNIKATQNKILNGFSKDMNYLRRIINEAYLMRFKPIYCDEDDFPRLYRSASCPVFTFDVKQRTPVAKRKRANSENIYYAKELMRIQSDTDLLCIDRAKTFAGPGAQFVKPAELIARVVNALGTISSDEDENDEGVNLFTDQEILSSEKKTNWAIGNDLIVPSSPKFRRSRALSVSVPYYRKQSQDSLPELLGVYKRPGKLSLPTDHIAVDNDGSRSRKPSMFSRFNPFKSSDSSIDKGFSPTDYIKKTVKGRMSLFQNSSSVDAYDEFKDKGRRGSLFQYNKRLPEDINTYHNRTKVGRGSLFAEDLDYYNSGHKSRNSRRESLADMDVSRQADALENTSVADLVRALATLHASSRPNDPTPTSLFDLFPSEMTAPSIKQIRRGSLHPMNTVSTPHSSQMRRGSLFPPTSLMEGTGAPPLGTRRIRRVSLKPLDPGEDINIGSGVSRRRRLSVRPTPSFEPVLETVTSGAELNTHVKPRQRKGSMYAPPPPYSASPEDLPNTLHRRFSPASSDEGLRSRRMSPASGGPVARKISRTGLFSNIKTDNNLEEVPTQSSESRSRRDSLFEVKIDDNKSQ